MNVAPIVTVNADFTDGPRTGLENVQHVLPGSVLTFVQEGKRVQFRDRLSWLLGVSQGHQDDARRNSAILWDRSRVDVLHTNVSLAVEPRSGDEILARFLRRLDCEVDGSLKASAIVGHRPPRYLKHLWPEFDEALEREVEYAPYPVIVGIDTNDLTPARLARSMGLRWSGRGIDGFMYSPELHVSRARSMKPTQSDHRAVLAFLET